MVTFANVKEAQQSSENDKNRFPLSGTIDEIGSDIQRLKTMSVKHIIYRYNFSSFDFETILSSPSRKRIVGSLAVPIFNLLP